MRYNLVIFLLFVCWFSPPSTTLISNNAIHFCDSREIWLDKQLSLTVSISITRQAVVILCGAQFQWTNNYCCLCRTVSLDKQLSHFVSSNSIGQAVVTLCVELYHWTSSCHSLCRAVSLDEQASRGPLVRLVRPDLVLHSSPSAQRCRDHACRSKLPGHPARCKQYYHVRKLLFGVHPEVHVCRH